MQASVYIVGAPDGPGAALRDIARQLTFARVLPYRDVASAEQQALQTPICYFLFAAVDEVRSLQPVAHAIRFCPSRRLRFSPLIYFADSPSLETIKACVNMGFDDVITLPFTLDRVTERLGRQLDRTLTYFETTSYIGPDRRGQSEQRPQQGQYRRLEIRRSLSTGVTIVGDEASPAA